MTEKEWLSATDLSQMLAWLQANGGSERKVRLFNVACCRRIWRLMADERSRDAIEVEERYSDGLATEQDRKLARRGAQEACQKASGSDLFRDSGVFASRAAYQVVGSGRLTSQSAADNAACALAVDAGHRNPWEVRESETRRSEMERQCELLKDIIGNPIRPVEVDPRWQTETVVALATGIFVDSAFDRMLILADALEEAGCDHAEVLNHCRGDGPHVRGCWVVDLVLGKG